VFQPSRLRILAVGRVKRPWLPEDVAQYQRRLPGLQLVEVKDSAREREALKIRAVLRRGERVVALCETGESLSSLGFADRLTRGGEGTG